MCERQGLGGIDLGGSIQDSFKGSWSLHCAHNGSIHKFSRSIDTLLKKDLDKKTDDKTQEILQQAFQKLKI